MRFDRPPIDRRQGVVDADKAQLGVDQSEAHRRSRADDVEKGAGLARGHCSGNLTCAAVVDLTNTALVVVDVQQAFDDADVWGRRNNPDCEANVAALIAAWRASRRPVVFVRHDSTEPGSSLAPDAPGKAFKPEASGEPDLLVTKQVNTAFHGDPDLAGWLRDRG